MKAELQQELRRVQLDNARAIEAARNQCEAEIRNYRHQAEQKKKQMLSGVREETRIDPGYRALVIDRIFSLRPQEQVKKLPVKLRLSRPHGLSVFDDELFEWTMTRPAVLFDIAAADLRRPSDELEFTFTEKRKKDLPPVEAFDIPDSEPDHMEIERLPDVGYQKVKKVQAGIEATSDRVFSRMNSAFDDLADDCREFKSFIQIEHRKLGKTVTDFRQRNLDAGRAIHQSVTEMQQAYQSALTSLAAARRSSELPTQVLNPLSYHVVTNGYSVPRRRSRSAHKRADRG
jgi:hypothetical protein